MKPWPTVKLGEVMQLSDTAQPSSELREVNLAGVYSFARGLFKRGPMSPADTSYKTYNRLVTDDFVISQPKAWEGAIARVTPEFDGWYLSPVFPTFRANKDKLDTKFLEWFCKREPVWTELQFKSRGIGARRETVAPEQFLTVEIPLPPLAEQRRIVARIEKLAAQIHQAQALRQQAAEETDALMASALSQACCGNSFREDKDAESARQLLNRISKIEWPGQVAARNRKPTPLPPPPEVPESWLVIEAGELQELGAILDIQDGNHGGDYPRKAEFGDDGVPFVTAKQFDNGMVRIADAPRLPHERASRLRIGFAKANDVLLTHNASVGDVAIAPSDAGDFLLGTSATYWRCNPEALERRYLFYFMQSEYFQGQLAFIMKQTTRNQVSVLKQVNLWICFPPLSEQRRIVEELDALQAEVDALKRQQAETAAELDALLPAILDRAFRGQL